MTDGIGIVGAGVAGLHLGLFLRGHDVPVTIYTERSGDDVAAGRLPNTVGHHHHTLERERALGVHHWDAAEYGYVCHHHYVGMDPPLHQKVRRIMRAAFTPNAVDSYEPVFRAHAKRIVDAVLPRGECEFVEEVAAELPLLAILELLGVDPADRKDFFHWTNTMIFADDPDMSVSELDGQLASLKVIEYALRLAAAARSKLALIDFLDNLAEVLVRADAKDRWLAAQVGFDVRPHGPAMQHDDHAP